MPNGMPMLRMPLALIGIGRFSCGGSRSGLTVASGFLKNASQIFETATFFAKKDVTGAWIKMPPGSPGRRKKLQTVNQLLSCCRDELVFEDRWHPTRNYTKFNGTAPKASAAGVKQKNKQDAVPEWAFKPFLESFPETQYKSGGELPPHHRKEVGPEAIRPTHLRWVGFTGDKGVVTAASVQLASGEPGYLPLGSHPDMSANRVNYYLEHMPDGYRLQLNEAAKAKGEILVA